MPRETRRPIPIKRLEKTRISFCWRCREVFELFLLFLVCLVLSFVIDRFTSGKKGSYTGMRTIERTSIMDLSGHISRLSTSLSLIHVVPTEQILPVPPVTSPKPVPAENARLDEPGEI